MPANLTFDALEDAVRTGGIDTVITALVDMQGRLMGKRFHAAHFIDGGFEETHCCNYLLATDLEMATVQGYAATSWATGYGDYVMKPDLGTLRRIPWAEGTALCMVDLLDRHGAPIPHAPRNVLRAQVERAAAMGLTAMMATELEFFLFEGTPSRHADSGFTHLTPVTRHNADYSLTGNIAAEPVMRDPQQPSRGGIPVECTKGEAEAGQEEINIRYAPAIETCDMHTLAKAATKEIAAAHDQSATFMAQYDERRTGSSAHLHQSLWRDGRNAFADPDAEHGMSALMRSYIAGQLGHAAGITLFLAPYINSYKRFLAGTFAPTKAVWSLDNRTAGFRVCGEGTKGVRIECRIGGSDLNPYLACAALLAAGLDGIERGLELEAPIAGDVYQAGKAREIPRTLGAAAEALHGSAMLRAALGDGVVDHYHRAALWEIEEHNRVVTDWERARGFERA